MGKMEVEAPRTLEEARAFVKHVESPFMPWNVDAIVEGFTEDCVVRFGDLPEMRALMGDTLANTREGEWRDAQTGRQMSGRGVEIWVMRGGRIPEIR